MTVGPTDGPTDGPTEKWLIESRSTQLKTLLPLYSGNGVAMKGGRGGCDVRQESSVYGTCHCQSFPKEYLGVGGET